MKYALSLILVLGLSCNSFAYPVIAKIYSNGSVYDVVEFNGYSSEYLTRWSSYCNSRNIVIKNHGEAEWVFYEKLKEVNRSSDYSYNIKFKNGRNVSVDEVRFITKCDSYSRKK